MKKLLPFLLPVIGIAAGIGAGLMLKPSPIPVPAETHQTTQDTHAAPEHTPDAHGTDHAAEPEYVKLNNQFIIPVIEQDEVSAIVVLSLSLEVTAGSIESIYAREPKLRDSFLQVLFDHSNMGGFHGSFTDASKMTSLRRSLLAVAQKAVGDLVSDVLITDLARQDV